MEQSSRAVGQTTYEHVVLNELFEKQKQSKEGSKIWHDCQEKINQIIAQNFLHYVNR